MRKFFSIDEIKTAECMGFTISEDLKTVIADVDYTSKVALFEFIKICDRFLLEGVNQKAKRDLIFPQIKQAFDRSYQTFINTFQPEKLYEQIGRKLYEHQIETLWLYQKKRINLCSFEQGLGKTIFAASVSKLFRIPRTIVVCPSLVKWNWVKDLGGEWGFNDMFFTVYDSKKTAMALMHERFVIINYEMLGKFYKELTFKDCGHIILDECHKIKRTTTLAYKNVKKLIDHYPDARVTLLTGTPVTNRIVDLFSYLKIAKHPLGDNFLKFKERYTVGKQKILGSQNEAELYARISNFMVRKKTEECIDLPELRKTRYYFDMSDEHVKEYKAEMDSLYEAQQMLAEVEEQINKMVADPYHDKEELKHLRNQKKELGFRSRGNINTMNRICANAKIPNIIKLIDNLNEQDEKVIVFAGYTETLETLKKHYGDSAVLINGAVPALKRQQYIDEFKKNPKVKVFIAQFIAGGIGINLVNSSKVIFCNLPFTPDWVEQPMKRAHRGGQVKDVDIMFTLIPDSIDERIYGMLESKGNDINKVVDRNKEHKLEFGSVQKQLFNDLIQDYKKQNNIQSNKEEFIKV